MEKQFTKMQMWNFIPYLDRMELVKKYGIKSSAPREVANNVLVKDGIMEQDLELVPAEVLHEVSGIPAIKLAKSKKKKEVEDKIIKEAKKVTEQKDEGKVIAKDEVKDVKSTAKKPI